MGNEHFCAVVIGRTKGHAITVIKSIWAFWYICRCLWWLTQAAKLRTTFNCTDH